MKVEYVRSAFDYDGDAVSRETGLSCEGDECIVQQQFAAEVDINTIVRRFGVTGHLPVAALPPSFGDFTGATDYQTALNALLSAQESFDRLPGELRARFGNDPGMLIAFLDDERNRDEAVRLGLVEKANEVPRAEV